MNNIKKENNLTQHQPHRILQRNSNVSLQLSARRHVNRTKVQDGIKFIGTTNEIKNKQTDKKQYEVDKQVFIEVKPEDPAPLVPLTYDELVTAEACPVLEKRVP